MNMRKVILTLFVTTAISSMAQSSMELTATEVATRMSPGWNLGNTLEAGDSDRLCEGTGFPFNPYPMCLGNGTYY